MCVCVCACVFVCVFVCAACTAHIPLGLHVGAPLDQRLHHLQLALLRGDVQRRSSNLHRRRRRVSPCECQRAPAPVPPPSRPPTGAFLLATAPPALHCCCCTAQHALGASWTRSTAPPHMLYGDITHDASTLWSRWLGEHVHSSSCSRHHSLQSAIVMS